MITDEIKGYFNEALKEYKSGRQKNLRACYDKMNALHFTKTELCNGVPTLVLLSEAERPTMRQFYYYANKQLTEQEKDVIKTSMQEQRNNKRLITSDSMFEVFGPGIWLKSTLVKQMFLLCLHLIRIKQLEGLSFTL